MIVLASWDDGSIEDLRVAELMQKYNIPCIFYWSVFTDIKTKVAVKSTRGKIKNSKSKVKKEYQEKKVKIANNFSKIKDFLSEGDRQKIAKDFEVGSHTLYHNFLTFISEEKAKTEISESKIIFQKKYNQKIDSFCYPRGYYNDSIKNMVKNAGYKTARATLIGNTSLPKDNYCITATAHVGIQRVEYEGTPWLQYCFDKLKEAEKNGYYHIFGHSWEIQKNNAWGDLEILLKAIKK